MTIKNTDDLRVAYLFMKALDSASDYVKSLKREIRKFTKSTSNNRIVKDYGIDGALYLYQLDGDFESKADAVEYFYDNEYIEAISSPFDCTGGAFTSWFKVFIRNNQFWVYHRVAYDV